MLIANKLTNSTPPLPPPPMIHCQDDKLSEILNFKKYSNLKKKTIFKFNKKNQSTPTIKIPNQNQLIINNPLTPPQK